MQTQNNNNNNNIYCCCCLLRSGRRITRVATNMHIAVFVDSACCFFSQPLFGLLVHFRISVGEKRVCQIMFTLCSHGITDQIQSARKEPLSPAGPILLFGNRARDLFLGNAIASSFSSSAVMLCSTRNIGIQIGTQRVSRNSSSRWHSIGLKNTR